MRRAGHVKRMTAGKLAPKIAETEKTARTQKVGKAAAGLGTE